MEVSLFFNYFAQDQTVKPIAGTEERPPQVLATLAALCDTPPISRKPRMVFAWDAGMCASRGIPETTQGERLPGGIGAGMPVGALHLEYGINISYE